MLPGVLISLLAAMVVGVVLFVVGLRGRRINDHPVCRQCHFDLRGIYPEVVTCPECGSGLKREHAVRVGERRRMPLVASAGVLLVLTPMVPVGAVGFAALTGRDVNAYKPLGLIFWEAKRADAKQGAKLADEVVNRIVSQKLSAGQYASAIDAVLGMQGDVSIPWNEAWGQVIERAELDGVLTPAQEMRYRQQAAVFTIASRAAIHAGGALPVEVKLKEARVQAGRVEIQRVSMASATLDGKALTRRPEKQAGGAAGGLSGPGAGFQQAFINGTPTSPSPDPTSMGTIVLRGSRPQARMPIQMFGQDFDGTLALEVPEGLAPGTHTLEVELELVPAQTAMGGMVFVNGKLQVAEGSAEPRRVRLSARVEIVPETVAVVTPRTISDEDQKAFAEKLNANVILMSTTATLVRDERGGLRTTDPTTRAGVRFNIAGLPHPIAYDVFVRADGKEQKLGELTSGKLPNLDENPSNASFSSYSFSVSINGVTQTSSSSSDSKDERTISGVIEPIAGDHADIVLRPSETLAAATLDLKEYANREIVLENVPIQQGDVRMDQGFGTMDPFGGVDPFAEMERLRQQQRQMMKQMQNGLIAPPPPKPRKPASTTPPTTTEPASTRDPT